MASQIDRGCGHLLGGLVRNLTDRDAGKNWTCAGPNIDGPNAPRKVHSFFLMEYMASEAVICRTQEVSHHSLAAAMLDGGAAAHALTTGRHGRRDRLGCVSSTLGRA